MPGRRIVLALLVLIAACGGEAGPAGSGEQEAGAASAAGEWWLVSFGSGAGVTPEVSGAAADVAGHGSPVTLVLRDDGRVSGFSGCNRFLGRATFDARGALSFGTLGSTRRACEEPNTALEQAYLDLLAQVDHYAVAGGTDGKRLNLATGSGAPLVVFRYAGPPAEMPAARRPSAEVESPPPDGGGDGGAP